MNTQKHALAQSAILTVSQGLWYKNDKDAGSSVGVVDNNEARSWRDGLNGERARIRDGGGRGIVLTTVGRQETATNWYTHNHNVYITLIDYIKKLCPLEENQPFSVLGIKFRALLGNHSVGKPHSKPEPGGRLIQRIF